MRLPRFEYEKPASLKEVLDIKLEYGKKAAILSIVGFVTILFAFFGVTLIMKGLHVFM